MDYGRRSNGGHNGGIRSSDDQNGLRSLCKNKVRIDRVLHFYERPWRSYAKRKIEKYVSDKTIGGSLYAIYISSKLTFACTVKLPSRSSRRMK